MATLRFHTEIRAPVTKVFDFVSQGENAPLWHASVKEAHHVTPPPIRLGTRLMMHALIGRKDYRWVQEVVTWDPPYRFTDRLTQATPSDGNVPTKAPFEEFEDRCVLAEKDGGTEMEFILHYQLPYGGLGRFLDWLFLRSRVRRDTEGSLRKLKGLMEAPPP